MLHSFIHFRDNDIYIIILNLYLFTQYMVLYKFILYILCFSFFFF